jgi:hypothetical protein
MRWIPIVVSLFFAVVLLTAAGPLARLRDTGVGGPVANRFQRRCVQWTLVVLAFYLYVVGDCQKLASKLLLAFVAVLQSYRVCSYRFRHFSHVHRRNLARKSRGNKANREVSSYKISRFL